MWSASAAELVRDSCTCIRAPHAQAFFAWVSVNALSNLHQSYHACVPSAAHTDFMCARALHVQMREAALLHFTICLNLLCQSSIVSICWSSNAAKVAWQQAAQAALCIKEVLGARVATGGLAVTEWLPRCRMAWRTHTADSSVQAIKLSVSADVVIS